MLLKVDEVVVHKVAMLLMTFTGNLFQQLYGMTTLVPLFRMFDYQQFKYSRDELVVVMFDTNRIEVRRVP
jgi:hypothetical protein